MVQPPLRGANASIFGVAAAVSMILLWRTVGLSTYGFGAGHPSRTARRYPPRLRGQHLLLGIRWHALVRMAGGAPLWTSSAEVFLTSVIVNYAAPIGLAVPTRAALTVRDLMLSPEQSGAVVGWEATLDVVALAIISVAWLFPGGADLVQTKVDGWVIVLLAVVVVLVAVLILGSSKSRRSVPASRLCRRMLSNPVEHPILALFAVGSRADSGHPTRHHGAL